MLCFLKNNNVQIAGSGKAPMTLTGVLPFAHILIVTKMANASFMSQLKKAFLIGFLKNNLKYPQDLTKERE